MKKARGIVLVLFVSPMLIFSSIGCAKKSMVRETAELPDQSSRKISQSARMDLRVASLAEAQRQATRIIAEEGGRVQESYADRDKRVTLDCRVPNSTLQATLDALGSLGDVRCRSVTSVDITESYFDLEARLKNNIALRDRLRSLLDSASTVADVVSVEKELFRVQAEVESMEARFAAMQASVEFSAVKVTLEPNRILGPLGYLAYGLGWVVKKLFVIR